MCSGHHDANRLTSKVREVPSGCRGGRGTRIRRSHSGNLVKRNELTGSGFSATDFTFDDDNRLVGSTRGGVSTTYGNDELGRRTSKASSEATTTYEWNVLGQLARIGSLENTATYSYGISGMREQIVVTDGTSSVTTQSFWNGMRLISEKDTGDVTATNYKYIYGPSGMPLELQVTESGQAMKRYGYMVDHAGSVIGLVEQGSSYPIVRYAYDAYGVPVDVDAEPGYEELGARNPLRYRGYYFDVESGLYYLPARYYEAESARFLSVDPVPASLGDPVSLNGYVYCAGSGLRSGHGEQRGLGCLC